MHHIFPRNSSLSSVIPTSWPASRPQRIVSKGVGTRTTLPGTYYLHISSRVFTGKRISIPTCLHIPWSSTLPFILYSRSLSSFHRFRIYHQLPHFHIAIIHHSAITHVANRHIGPQFLVNSSRRHSFSNEYLIHHLLSLVFAPSFIHGAHCSIRIAHTFGIFSPIRRSLFHVITLQIPCRQVATPPSQFCPNTFCHLKHTTRIINTLFVDNIPPLHYSNFCKNI